MLNFDWVTWATIGGTWALVVGTLSFAYWQMKQAQRLHSATTILELRERYHNPRMLTARRQFSKDLLSGKPEGDFVNMEVAHFFELMGFLTHTGVLDKRMVWNAFGNWVTSYYLILDGPDGRVKKWRTESKDFLVYAEFEWLCQEMESLNRSLLRQPADTPPDLEEARWILELETTVGSQSEL